MRIDTELHLLLVEDQAGDAALIQHALDASSPQEVHTTHVTRIAEAKRALSDGDFDAVLLDLQLPDSTGLTTLRTIRKLFPRIPVVVLSGNDVRDLSREAVEEGAYAFLLKDWVMDTKVGPRLLERTLVYSIEAQHKAEHLETVNAQLAAANARLANEACIDPLTRLFNRRGLEAEIERAVRLSKRSERPLVAAFIDCDDFKQVNDVFGHAVGDLVLAEIARRLRVSTRPDDIVARVGGDEFAVVLPSTELRDGVAILERTRKAVASSRLVIDGEQVEFGISVGVAAIPLEGTSVDDIVEFTTEALALSKEEGKNRVRSLPQPRGSTGGQTIVHRLLVGTGALEVDVQPLFRLPELTEVGHELFVRGPDSETSNPAALLRMAESEGLGPRFDLLCLRTCLEAARTIEGDGWLCLNLLPETLTHCGAARLVDLLAEFLPPERICIELPMASLSPCPSELPKLVAELKKAKISVAIDDVGFGQSALEALVALEPNLVKLDAECVRGAGSSETRHHRLGILHALVQRLGCESVAEGIETRSDLEAVQAIGISLAQGYFLGHPAPVGKKAPSRTFPTEP